MRRMGDLEDVKAVMQIFRGKAVRTYLVSIKEKKQRHLQKNQIKSGNSSHVNASAFNF